MYAKFAFTTLAIATLAAAHGKVAVITGNLGGNGTALGIKGAVVPGAGPNHLTEVDTTVYRSQDITTDNDLGRTEDGGDNKLSDLAATMQLSGSTLPQVSSGGSINGTYHIVTSDGAGPLEAIIDESATGKWSTATSAKVTVQPPGDKGDIAPSNNNKRSRIYGQLSKRAVNINEDYPFAVEIPAGTSCTGTINGVSGLCLVKVSNNNKNGPFGGVFAVQMSNSTTTAASNSTAAATTSSNSTSASA